MKFEEYEYRDNEWTFDRIRLGPVALFVGASGSGKTRLFNTMFNLGVFIASGLTLRSGKWAIKFSSEDVRYTYELETADVGPDDVDVKQEKLTIQLKGEDVTLVERDGDFAKFKGTTLPKFTKKASLLNLLREETDIAPVIKAFSSIKRRSFSDGTLDNVKTPIMLGKNILAEMNRQQSLGAIHGLDLPSLHGTLHLVKQNSAKEFEWIAAAFKEVFPFVSDLDIKSNDELAKQSTTDNIPLVVMKERGVANWIPLMEWSSGMVKVLLMLTDVATIPKGTVYMIDEYENSLGVNAINFLPNLIEDRKEDLQFLLTSHHPYLINKIPIRDWFVFGRQGHHVAIKYGEELKQRYGQSKQQAFSQLLNDSFYTEGRA